MSFSLPTGLEILSDWQHTHWMHQFCSPMAPRNGSVSCNRLHMLTACASPPMCGWLVLLKAWLMPNGATNMRNKNTGEDCGVQRWTSWVGVCQLSIVHTPVCKTTTLTPFSMRLRKGTSGLPVKLWRFEETNVWIQWTSISFQISWFMGMNLLHVSFKTVHFYGCLCRCQLANQSCQRKNTQGRFMPSLVQWPKHACACQSCGGIAKRIMDHGAVFLAEKRMNAEFEVRSTLTLWRICEITWPKGQNDCPYHGMEHLSRSQPASLALSMANKTQQASHLGV